MRSHGSDRLTEKGLTQKKKVRFNRTFLVSLARVQVLGSGISRLLPRQLNQLLKGCLVPNCHVGQNLPV